jgi:hypothetical protein
MGREARANAARKASAMATPEMQEVVEMLQAAADAVMKELIHALPDNKPLMQLVWDGSSMSVMCFQVENPSWAKPGIGFGVQIRVGMLEHPDRPDAGYNWVKRTHGP